MLASQTGLPLLQKYIHEKNHGSVIQKITEKVIAADRLGGELVTPGMTSRLKPNAAMSRRSARFSYGCGSHSAHASQNSGCPTIVEKPSARMRHSEGCRMGSTSGCSSP